MSRGSSRALRVDAAPGRVLVLIAGLSLVCTPAGVTMAQVYGPEQGEQGNAAGDRDVDTGTTDGPGNGSPPAVSPGTGAREADEGDPGDGEPPAESPSPATEDLEPPPEEASTKTASENETGGTSVEGEAPEAAPSRG